MKFWFEAQMEITDATRTCGECGGFSAAPDKIFVEFKLVGGGNPNPNDLHPEPTGNILCYKCGKVELI